MPHKGSKWKSPMYKRSDGQSLVDWCNENGFNYHTLRQRIIEEDISVDEACASANRKRLRREWETDGLSLRQYCIEKNLVYNTIYYRVKILGLPLSEAEQIEKYRVNSKKRGKR